MSDKHTRRANVHAMGLTTSVVNKLAFIPPPPQYEAGDVTHWVRTRFGNKLPVCVYRHTKCDFRSRFRRHFYRSTGDCAFRSPRFTILFSHGNAEDLGQCMYFCRWLSETLQAEPFALSYMRTVACPDETPDFRRLRAVLLRPRLLNGRAPCDRPCTLRST